MSKLLAPFFLHLAHAALSKSRVKSSPTQAARLPEDRSLPSSSPLLSSPPTEQVVDLPGERSRQAPAAAAGAQTRRACFRGFNPQLEGRKKAVHHTDE
uniref:uncharacterized protein LOC143311909 isoform X2 n=1 Tax=Arvicanthis niloticus TaxID=61156 RepID=UPI00402B2529